MKWKQRLLKKIRRKKVVFNTVLSIWELRLRAHSNFLSMPVRHHMFNCIIQFVILIVVRQQFWTFLPELWFFSKLELAFFMKGRLMILLWIALLEFFFIELLTGWDSQNLFVELMKMVFIRSRMTLLKIWSVLFLLDCFMIFV